MRISRIAIYTLVVMAAAAALHAYEQLAKSSDPSPVFFLWSMFPYTVCLLILLSCDSAIPAAVGTTSVFGFDCYTYYTVFVAPKSSTAALAVFFMPLFNAFLIAPVVMFLIWLIMRLYFRRTHTQPDYGTNGGG